MCKKVGLHFSCPGLQIRFSLRDVSVCENQIKSKLRQFVYNSMEEIDSHNQMLRES